MYKNLAVDCAQKLTNLEKLTNLSAQFAVDSLELWKKYINIKCSIWLEEFFGGGPKSYPKYN